MNPDPELVHLAAMQWPSCWKLWRGPHWCRWNADRGDWPFRLQFLVDLHQPLYEANFVCLLSLWRVELPPCLILPLNVEWAPHWQCGFTHQDWENGFVAEHWGGVLESRYHEYRAIAWCTTNSAAVELRRTLQSLESAA